MQGPQNSTATKELANPCKLAELAKGTQVWASVSDLAFEQTDSAGSTNGDGVEAEASATAPCGTSVPHSSRVAHAGWSSMTSPSITKNNNKAKPTPLAKEGLE